MFTNMEGELVFEEGWSKVRPAEAGLTGWGDPFGDSTNHEICKVAAFS
jgi:hypothetical protein